MAKQKPAKEVLRDYSSQELTDILIEELKAVGIEYTVDSDGCGTEFVPLSNNDFVLDAEQNRRDFNEIVHA